MTCFDRCKRGALKRIANIIANDMLQSRCQTAVVCARDTTKPLLNESSIVRGGYNIVDLLRWFCADIGGVMLLILVL